MSIVGEWQPIEQLDTNDSITVIAFYDDECYSMTSSLNLKLSDSYFRNGELVNHKITHFAKINPPC